MALTYDLFKCRFKEDDETHAQNNYPLYHGDVSQFVERRIGTALTPVRFPSAARTISPTVNFQCTLLWSPYTLVCNRMH